MHPQSFVLCSHNHLSCASTIICLMQPQSFVVCIHNHCLMRPQSFVVCIHNHLSYAATIICRVHPQSFVIAFYHAHNKIASTLHSVQPQSFKPKWLTQQCGMISKNIFISRSCMSSSDLLYPPPLPIVYSCACKDPHPPPHQRGKRSALFQGPVQTYFLFYYILYSPPHTVT